MTDPMYYAIDAITGEITERELTPEEIAAFSEPAEPLPE